MRVQLLLGLAYIAVSLSAIARGSGAPGGKSIVHSQVGNSSGQEWFLKAKPFCNALEVDIGLQKFPPPSGAEGTAFGIACRAVAGQIDQAREAIRRLSIGGRGEAAQVLFQVGHPIADAGDDRAAGPIMELVLEFWPENYMAMYHAGMSAYTTGRPVVAAKHLTDFLASYPSADGWRSSAIQTLNLLDANR